MKAVVSRKYKEFLRATQSLPEQVKRAVLRGFSLAIVKHQGQFYTPKERFPYCYHLVSVALKVIDYGIQDPAPILLALWHDIIEDRKITKKGLETHIRENREEYSKIDLDRIVFLLNKLNRKNYSGSYPKATQKYYQAISENSETLIVKCADLASNVEEYLNYLDYIKSKKPHLIPKYFGEFVNFLTKNKNFQRFKLKDKIERELISLFKQIFNQLNPGDIKNFQAIARKKYGYDFKKALRFFQ